MKKKSKKEKLTCIYCSEKQECSAIDYIPTVLNLSGENPKIYNKDIQDVQCSECDELFYVALVNENIIASNLPSKIQNLIEQEKFHDHNLKIDSISMMS